MPVICDDPATFADEAIDGFVAANRDRVVRVDGGVVRAQESPPGEVAVVIGGGSGHYPVFAGMVGNGLAAGAAWGTFRVPFGRPGVPGGEGCRERRRGALQLWQLC